MSISDRLDEIQARHQKATKGEWRFSTEPGTQNHTITFEDGWPIANDNEGVWFLKEDAEFISEAKNHDVPWLIEQVRKCDAALRAVLDVCDGLEEAHRANPEQTYEYGLEEAAHQVRNAVEAALGEVADQ